MSPKLVASLGLSNSPLIGLTQLLGLVFTVLLNSVLKCALRTMAHRGVNAAETGKP
jgi:hypothetical protein